MRDVISELRTPVVLVDVERVRANIARMQRTATANGVRLRPHAKTHKSPVIARWQIAQGAIGICCAKLGEAEVFAEAGIEDIRLPYPVNPANADRVIALLDRVRLSIIVDHPAVARGWSEAMQTAGQTLDVLVKVDVGYHRCGIDPASPEAGAFVAHVGTLPGLRLKGLLSHAGHAYHARSEEDLRAMAAAEARLLQEVAVTARAQGARIDEISVGATPTARFSAGEKRVTELRPGNYVYFDRSQVGLGSATLDQCALTILATVVTKHEDRVIFDCGSKTLALDQARGASQPGHGLVFRGLDASSPDDNLRIEQLSEEHAIVRVLNGSTPLEPGDRVRILPNHACVVSNLVNEITLVEEDRVVDRLPVAARGLIA